MVRTLLIVAAAGIVLSIVTLGGAAVIAGPDLRNGWYFDENGWSSLDHDEGPRGAHGPRVERTLEWTGGDSLTVALPADVIFTQGAEASVRLRGPQSLVDRITLTDGRLDMEEDGQGGRLIGYWSDHDDRLRIEVTAPDVSRFLVEGSGDLRLHGIDVADLTVEVEGSGDIEAIGRATTLTASVRGSGDADLDDLTAARATLRVEGSGDLSAHATETADVQIDGSGDISLRSRPASLNQVINGSGDVRVGD